MLDASSGQSVLDYLVGNGWQYKITNQEKQRYIGPCPLGHHDNDHINPRFSVHANRNLFGCFKCSLQGGGIQSLKEQLGEGPGVSIRAVAMPKLPVSKTKAKISNKQRQQFEGATLEELCKAKGINLEYAKNTLGWKDVRYGRRGDTRAVEIPYFGLDGERIDARYRVGISHGTRILTRKGAKALPYGLQNLSQSRAGNYIIIEEGETDWAALDEVGFNALGIPGVNSWKPEWTIHLNGIETVYVWQETGQAKCYKCQESWDAKPPAESLCPQCDRQCLTPGQQMARRISLCRGEVFVITAPPEGKDPCEIRQKVGDQAFMALMDQLMLDAKPYNAIKAEQVSRTGVDPDAPGYGQAKILPNPTPGVMLGHPSGCQDAHAKAHNIARNHKKPVNYSTLAWDHRKIWKDQNPENRQFHTLSDQGVKQSIFCNYFDNPRLLAGQNQMENIIAGSLGQVDLSGNAVPAYTNIVDCGRNAGMNCDTHGERYAFTHPCRQNFCPNCGTQASNQAGRVKMPWLTGEAHYLHVVWQTITAIPDNPDHWGPVFNRQIDTWQKTLKHASTWKECKGKLYYRSHATYYGVIDGQIVAVTTWKALFHEEREGALTKTIGKITKAMGALVISELRDQKNETATLQTVLDFMTHFIGIDPSLPHSVQCQLFLGHYNATTGRHIFQAYGLLRKLIEELPETEPQICDVAGCGMRLREVLGKKITGGSGDNGHNTNHTNRGYQ